MDALPRDVFLLVSRFLTGFELLALSHTNRRLFRDLLASNGVVWRSRLPSRDFACSDPWRARMQVIDTQKPRWKTKYKRFLGDLKDAVRTKRTPSTDQQNKGPSYKELYMTSLSLRFAVDPSKRRVGSAVQLGDGVRTAWNSDAFSFDVWFAVLPPSSSGGNTGEFSVLLGAQTFVWPQLDAIEGSCKPFVFVDRLGFLHCSMTTESLPVGSRLQHERWYHVALSFRRSSDDWWNGEQRVFVDGELVHVSEGRMHPRWRFLNFAQVGSGCLDPSQVDTEPTATTRMQWYGFEGVVDDCRFWRGALSDAQAKLLHQGEEDQVVEAGVSCAWSLKQDADAKFYGSTYEFVRSTRPREKNYVQWSEHIEQDIELIMDASSFMDPWWQIIQAHRLFPSHSDYTRPWLGNESVFQITLVPREVSPAVNIEQRCRALRDALELVFLQSVVDRRAFVERHFNQGPDEWKRGRVNRLPDEDNGDRCDVEIKYDFERPFNRGQLELEPTWIRAGICTLLTPQLLRERDQAFQDARRQLLLVAKSRCVTPRSSLTMGIDCVTRLTTELASFVRTGPAPSLDYPFRSVVVECDIPTRPRQATADIMACLDDAHKRIQLGYARIGDGVDRADMNFTHALLRLFNPAYKTIPTPLAHENAEETPGAYINAAIPTNLRLARQLCSAVMHARCVESLTVDWPRAFGAALQNHHQFMQWIMLSLFSSHTNHSIRRVGVRGFPASDVDIADYESFLQSAAHLSSVWGDQVPPLKAESFEPHEQVFLPRGTNLRLQPMTTDDIPTREWPSVQLHASGWMDVVPSTPELGYYDTLVPAYGVRRVHRAEVQQRRTVNPHPDHGLPVNHKVKSLMVGCYERRCRNYGGLFSFLRLVGAPLEELSLKLVTVSSTFLEEVLAACPSIKTLELSVVTSDVFAHVVSMYESTSCKVTSLRLRHVQRRHGFDDLVQFCEALSDRDRRISQTFTNLSLDIGAQSAQNLSDREVSALADMLERNPTLVSCSVTTSDERTEEIATLLHANGDPSFDTRRVAPLGLRSKLAFLSVIDASARVPVSAAISTTPAAIATLDCDAIARIFELAGVRRKVWVTGPRDW